MWKTERHTIKSTKKLKELSKNKKQKVKRHQRAAIATPGPQNANDLVRAGTSHEYRQRRVKMACNLDPTKLTKHINRPQAQKYIPDITTFTANENFKKAITKEMQDALNRKAEKADELFVEAFRLHSKSVGNVLPALLQKCANIGYLLEEWKTAMYVPKYKRGDVEDSDSYRPIALMPHARNVVEAAIDI